MKKTLIALAAAVIAVANMASAQNAQNFFKYTVGDYEVFLLSEGQGNGNTRILLDAPAEAVSKYIPEGTFPNATNAFLIKAPGENILVDAGYGRELGNNLKAAGLTENDIDRIILTHMHGDHIGGLLREGKKVFDAPMEVSIVEAAYWTEQGGNAKNVLEIYNPKRIATVKVGLEPEGDGIFAIEAYGHTPGHTAFLLSSKGEKLLIWGDVTHAMAIQMPHPEISVTYDADPVKARESRLEILKYVTENKIPIAGMHIAYPAIGTIEKDNFSGGYKFIPAK